MAPLAILGLSLLLLQPSKTHRVVIEMNVPGTDAYNFVLGNVEHIREAFAPEPIQIEVVCHGPGIDMLLTTNKVAQRVAKDAKLGVRFAACHNTIVGRHIDPSHLDKFAVIVPSGAAEVIRKQESGWSYLKGAY